ncbi:MAG: Trm112 family protein [Cenarchaeum sp. SB0665_bin_23]|nr:Trm112 family protein [Cenarchaeum sp. SB0667_bin_13]MXY37319.1 Trm112 family protein [Cenarchaeum sp. SB0664_bin_35]MXY61768.1 Trm112 family protein [Cenarchaeum sp. SB0665_bin_23]MXZ93563.1 Trm112 family protein [Cenarchaeum sp. SB0666_bin_15]MYB47209.1 Trm112 family protein [Cenarchaeum sp. SB0662_bin_33]MYC80253.1 Trm112 family protein [Cenarchaeum sp. SB0661_bin_35]MYD58654.1 Trm112 family protein [Cenarchaeum sp. SB0678_bin_8]MYG32554.1 Trm112 family protein [Cenarchaeum sp. SB0677_
MNRKLLDILACPIDRYYPLELHGDDGSDSVQTAILYCTKCTRFYVIDDGIPVLLPDDLRDRDAEMKIIHKIDNLPDKIRLHGKPWSIT